MTGHNAATPILVALATNEAARYVGRAAQTLRSWRCQGVGPAYIRQGTGPKARVVYLREDLDSWLRAQRVVPGGGARHELAGHGPMAI